MKGILLSAILLFAVVCVDAQQKVTKDQSKVNNTVVAMFKALADGDIEKLKTYCTNDIIILEDGAIWNLDTLTQLMSQDKPADFKRINSFQFIDTRVSRNVAWTTYNNQAEVTYNDRHVLIKWLETAILIRERKLWKIKTLHSTLLERNQTQ